MVGARGDVVDAPLKIVEEIWLSAVIAIVAVTLFDLVRVVLKALE